MPGFLLDTSVWIAWFFQKHPHHLLAINLLKARSNSDPAWLCRATDQSFLRLATTAAVCRAYSTPAFTNIEATAALGTWRTHPHILCLDAEPAGARELWLELAAIPFASPKVWMNAYLAAFAIRAGIALATLDSDFRRFEECGLSLRLLTE